jgi:hemerythrin
MAIEWQEELATGIMKRLLIRWLIQHIKHLDMAYVDFLKGSYADRQKEPKP